MSFSKDFGFEPVDEIQLTTLDSRTRNRLYNTFSDVMDCSNEADKIYAILADKLGYIKGYYMLVSCSAFINYLKVKFEQIQE